MVQCMEKVTLTKNWQCFSLFKLQGAVNSETLNFSVRRLTVQCQSIVFCVQVQVHPQVVQWYRREGSFCLFLADYHQGKSWLLVSCHTLVLHVLEINSSNSLPSYLSLLLYTYHAILLLIMVSGEGTHNQTALPFFHYDVTWAEMALRNGVLVWPDRH